MTTPTSAGTEAVVVVGSSYSGTAAARELRLQGFEGDVLLLDRTPSPSFDRTELTKRGLREAVEESYRPRWLNARLDEELSTTRRTATVVGIDTAEQTLRLLDGDQIQYGSLIVASGADARNPWSTVPGLHQLRTLDDLESIRDAIAKQEATDEGRHCVVIGAGLVGMEAAHSLVQRGWSVTCIEAAATPWATVLPPELGQRLAAEGGVGILTERIVSGIRQSPGGGHSIQLDHGEVVDADLTIVAIGAAPSTGWLGDAVDRSASGHLKCDAYLRTSDPNIWAAGDVVVLPTEQPLCHVTDAMLSGRIAARNLQLSRTQSGALVEYQGGDYFWTELGRTEVQCVGAVQPSLEVVWLDDDRHELAATLSADSSHTPALPVGVVLIGANRLVPRARQLLRTRASVADLRTDLTPTIEGSRA